MRLLLRGIVVAIVGGFLAIQVVPYGRDHENPPVVAEPTWNSPETRALVVDACFDCHSNETVWPWYSNVAPFSWLVQRDIEEGREELNFSEWTGEAEGEDAAETVIEGSMPPDAYTILHPKARLSEEQKARLVDGLNRTFGSDESLNRSDNDGEGEEDEDD